jgi:hypothetical protein
VYSHGCDISLETGYVLKLGMSLFLFLQRMILIGSLRLVCCCAVVQLSIPDAHLGIVCSFFFFFGSMLRVVD